MKIGFIGCGNMATAMLKGILKSGEVAATDMIASAKSDKTRKKIEQELGIQKADTNAQVVDFADVVFLAVKPQFLEGVLNEIKDSVKEEQIFISIAPGKTITVAWGTSWERRQRLSVLCQILRQWLVRE